MQWGRALVCEACIARFAAPRPRCRLCGQPLSDEALPCIACSREPPPFVRTVCAVDYAFPWDGLIGRFKFGSHPELAGVFAGLLSAALGRLGSGIEQGPARASLAAHNTPLASLVVPVPLAPARLAERGFNQAWELARRVAAALGLPAAPAALQRVLDTPHQAQLTREERQRNLGNAFMPDARQRARIAGAEVALVDDVLTTGATARECAAALRRAGAASVQLWVLARTP
jgi:ComF family protein